MIELTDEMREAGWDALPVTVRGSGEVDLDDMTQVVAAVLAIVERDYAIGPRACWEPAPGEPMAYCELAEGHKGTHSATVEKAVDW